MEEALTVGNLVWFLVIAAITFGVVGFLWWFLSMISDQWKH